jgi:hypothetical protein
MAKQIYIEGRNHMLRVYFSGEVYTGDFYVGLGTGAFPSDENATLDDITEVEGANYSRQKILRNDTQDGWDIVDDLATGTQVEFYNTDLDTTWTEADYMFLTLSRYQDEAPTDLIVAVDLSNTLILQPGERFQVVFKYQQV